jgi:hypothetical protein
MAKLDEVALRRSTFEDGAPVTLADGQEWRLPRPRVRFVPDDSDQGFQVRLALDDAGVFRSLKAAVDAAETNGALWKTELALARHLLLVNYDLTREQVADLLQFSYGENADPAGAAIREAVMGVAFGIGPKASEPGSAPPS